MRKRSLKQFLFGRLILMVIFPIFLISSAAILISVDSVKESIERRNTAILALLNHVLEHSENNLSQTGGIFLNEYTGAHEKNKFLNKLAKDYEDFEKIQVLDLNGNVRYSSLGSTEIGNDMSNFEPVKKTMNGSLVSWSGVLISLNGNPIIMVAKKIGQNILVGQLDIEKFSSILKGTIQNSTSKMMVLDKEGNSIFHDGEDISSEDKNILRYEYVSKIKNNDVYKTNFIKGNGRGNIIQNYMRLRKPEWTIVFIEEAGKSFVFMWDFYKQILFVLALLAFVMIFTTYSITKSILSDVNKLKVISKNVIEGKICRNEDYMVSETLELADKFFEMGKVILEREKSIKEKALFLQNLIDTIPSPVFYKDKYHVYLGCNDAFADYIGIEKEKFPGKTVYDVAPKDKADVYKKADDEILEIGETQIYQTKVVDAFGNERDVKFYKSVFRNFNGEKAGIIGIMLDVTELRKIQDKLKKLSVKDSLTEIYNRRGFEELSNNRWREAIRYKKDVSVIMLDIDNFKLYNDHYGHQAGDECLKKIAATLANSCKRPSDIVGRYGGEEFIILLFDTNLDGAWGVAESIRKNIEGLNIEHIGSKGEKIVTASFGVAYQKPEREDKIDKLICNADKLLYKAKESGKNRVIF